MKRDCDLRKRMKVVFKIIVILSPKYQLITAVQIDEFSNIISKKNNEKIMLLAGTNVPETLSPGEVAGITIPIEVVEIKGLKRNIEKQILKRMELISIDCGIPYYKNFKVIPTKNTV